MCLIIASPIGVSPIPRREFVLANQDNPHGIGLACWHQGKAIIVKTFSVGKALATYSRWRKLKRDVIVHFRWATHGKVCKELCHPFLTKSGIPLMHNGMIARLFPFTDKDNSDTKVLAGLMDEWGIDSFKTLDSLIEYAGSGNRFAAIGPFGISVAGGQWVANRWYSTAPPTRQRYTVIRSKGAQLHEPSINERWEKLSKEWDRWDKRESNSLDWKEWDKGVRMVDKTASASVQLA